MFLLEKKSHLENELLSSLPASVGPTRAAQLGGSPPEPAHPPKTCDPAMTYVGRNFPRHSY
jgi:hypothetical protein